MIDLAFGSVTLPVYRYDASRAMTCEREAVEGKEGDRTRLCRTRTAVATVGSICEPLTR